MNDVFDCILIYSLNWNCELIPQYSYFSDVTSFDIITFHQLTSWVEHAKAFLNAVNHNWFDLGQLNNPRELFLHAEPGAHSIPLLEGHAWQWLWISSVASWGHPCLCHLRHLLGDRPWRHASQLQLARSWLYSQRP